MVSWSDSVGRSRWASSEMPKKKAPRMATMATSVLAALRDAGRRKAGTAMLIASTPVRATAPDEKARMRAKTVTPARTPEAGVNSARSAARTGRAARLPENDR
jgi:hypothetical protein